MSIYPVKLSEWFKPGDGLFNVVNWIIKGTRCLSCDKKLRYSSAIGHHSVPWGNGDVWCSWKCCESGKVARVDKRRLRRNKRKYKYKWLEIKN